MKALCQAVLLWVLKPMSTVVFPTNARIEPIPKMRNPSYTASTRSEGFVPVSHLTSHEALRLTANFAFTADRMRAADQDFATRARICETASRIAFLRAHSLARREQILPNLGECYRRDAFSVA